MGSEERNFRTQYYGKVGFRGVEEKKSLNILLKDVPLDATKLSQFCLRFAVPSAYRKFVWKVLLGILPRHQHLHEFCVQQFTEQYHYLHNVVQSMRLVTSSTPLSVLHLLMYHLENGSLIFSYEDLKTNQEGKTFTALSDVFEEVTKDGDQIEIYFLTKGFFKLLQEKYGDSMNILPNHIKHYLEKEDSALFKHLSKDWDYLPLREWCLTCFATLLPEPAIERVWDPVIGGSCMVMVFVAVATLITLRRPLLSVSDRSDMLVLLHRVEADTAVIISSKAVDLWQKYGSLLIPAARA